MKSPAAAEFIGQPFDRIVLRDNGRSLELSVQEFFALPLSTRIRHVIERTVTFYSNGRAIDQKDALAALRWQRSSGTR